MRSRRCRRLVFHALLLALAASSGTTASAEFARWDQARVTALARELSQKANAVAEALRTGPQSDIGSGQASAFYRLKQDVRRARLDAAQLAAELEKGHGREETLPIYEELMVKVRDTTENARRMFMPDSTLEALAAAGDVLNRISPYYVEQRRGD